MDHLFEDDTLLARWLSGEISEAEKQELEQHPDFPHWKKIVEASNRLISPQFDRNAAWEKFKAARPKTTRRKLNVQRIALGIAAAVLIVLGYNFWPGDRNKALETQIGEQINYTLPDNSQIRLNASSSITWNKDNWMQNRELSLQGEAYFSVKPGSSFRVIGSQGSVEVLGTRFNVFDRPEEGFVVTCYEGTVAVSYPGSENISLEAGEEAQLRGNSIVKNSIAPGNSPHWTPGETIFRNKPLPLVFRELSRQYGVQVKLVQVDPKPYTGPMPHDNLKNALDIICNSLGLRYEIVKDKLVRIQED